MLRHLASRSSALSARLCKRQLKLSVDSQYRSFRLLSPNLLSSKSGNYARKFTDGRRYYSPSHVALKPLSSALQDEGEDSAEPSEQPRRQRTVEEQYSRKTPLEHILLRPGMYIGPTERLPPNTCWVLDHVAEDQVRMVRKEYGVVPALIKIFDEILVNASDNRLRHAKSCTRIDVVIDPGDIDAGRPPFISVFNDGKGIPIQKHQKEKLYIPELLFGHLLTGSNFDDSERRVTGGRHGYGAKLTNIFSKSFTVETLDSRKRKRYRQTWEDNMSLSTIPEITITEAGETDYTCISFVPDMVRLTGRPDAVAIDAEDYAVMCRRVVDVAGCAAGHLTVTLNGMDMSLATFEEYSNLYRPEKSPPLVYKKINSRWEVGVGLSDSGSFESVSFVNGMATPRGGTHINAIVQQITGGIAARVAKLNPELRDSVTQGLIRRSVFVSCNALIENPTFDSQMKESLTSNPNSFGSSCELPKKFLADLVVDEEDGGPGIVEEVVRVLRGRQQANLLKQVGGKKTSRQLLSIPKLEDAHNAGRNEGSSCTLILTEGDSAKALAVAGLEVIGREKYGVFPLRGKFLNVRHATVAQMTSNAEVKALCQIIGLDFDKEYDTAAERSELRYGHVMLMTDQDNDGSHIKGLLMNFFRHFWPKLLKPAVDHPLDKPFLSSFITPLLKVTRKGKKETLSFYSVADYNKWRASLASPDEIKKWDVKYYKGLGTSTPAEAKEYFSAFASHHRPFHWHSDIDGQLLDMVFDKERAADRRQWILDEFDEESTINPDPDRNNSITYEDFINNEMVHFSHADNVRSLPSVMDGLKPSQRKVLYACFKRKLKSEIKVAQLSGYCAEHTAYHHGEASLQSTIIGMAQDFVGSNNINLLMPSGQFGTRLDGGKDAASPRYIFTYLSPLARLLFPEVDDMLLTHREDDGQVIEPYFYCPIIPLLLVNGSNGIGSGWSTFIPPHNPRDVLQYIRVKLDGSTDLPPIRPWARGFEGSLELREGVEGYVSVGKAEPTSNKRLLISELPVGTWTNAYKLHLLNMRDKGKIGSFIENHTTSKVSFTVSLKADQKNLMKGLPKAFKLESNLLTTNMHAFGADNSIHKFESASSIADEFFPTRLALYHDRKSVLESEMNHASTMLENKARFIESVSNGQIDLIQGKRSKSETEGALRQLGFASTIDLHEIRTANVLAERLKKDGESDEESTKENDPDSGDFDYLLNMPLSSLTTEKISNLRAEARKTEKELSEIRKQSPEDLWRADLDKLDSQL